MSKYIELAPCPKCGAEIIEVTNRSTGKVERWDFVDTTTTILHVCKKGNEDAVDKSNEKGGG